MNDTEWAVLREQERARIQRANDDLKNRPVVAPSNIRTCPVCRVISMTVRKVR